MPLAVTAKISALLDGLTTDQLDELSPVERRRFADTLRYWAERAEVGRRTEPQPSGVLDALRHSRGHE